MEQEIMSALFEDEAQNDGKDEISSAWQPRPGCNPVDEKAVHDLLVWEEEWKKQVMERKKKIDEEPSGSILPEPWPPTGQPNERKRKHSMDNPEEPAIAVVNLLNWEEEWDQQYNTTCHNLYSFDLTETNEVVLLDLELQSTEEIASPVTGFGDPLD